MNSPRRRYMAFGLRIDSEVPLPFAPSVAPDASEPDVTVRIGTTPTALTHPNVARGRVWYAEPGTFLVNLANVGRYLAIGGREIRVQPSGGSRRELGRHLVGSPLGAVLQQRGLVTLHAAAVATDTGAVLFAGRGGMGKSSLVGALVQRGYAMLSDGFTAVARGAGDPASADQLFTALPGLPGLRLRPDALAELNCRPQAHSRVRAGIEKYLLPVANFQATPLSLRAVYVLTAHDQAETAIERLSTGSAFCALRSHTYRKRVLAALGQQLPLFRAISAMARQLPVHRVKRPDRPFLLHGLAARIDEDLRKAASSASALATDTAGRGRAAEQPFVDRRRPA